MKDHVTSLSWSKRLKECGFPQKSEFYWVNSCYSSGYEGGDVIWLCDNVWHLYPIRPDTSYHETGFIKGEYHEIHRDLINETEIRKKIDSIKVYSAPLVTEILSELPSGIEFVKVAGIYGVSYGLTFGSNDTKNICNALAEMYEYLAKNKLLKGRKEMSNNDLWCSKCKSHHHPVECPLDKIKDKITVEDSGSVMKISKFLDRKNIEALLQVWGISTELGLRYKLSKAIFDMVEKYYGGKKK